VTISDSAGRPAALVTGGSKWPRRNATCGSLAQGGATADDHRHAHALRSNPDPGLFVAAELSTPGGGAQNRLIPTAAGRLRRLDILPHRSAARTRVPGLATSSGAPPVPRGSRDKPP